MNAKKSRVTNRGGGAIGIEDDRIENPGGTGGKAGPGTHPRMTDGIFAYHDRG